MEPSISGCTAGEREWTRWCLLLIQKMHTHFHWLTAQYRTITEKLLSLCICLQGGLLRLLILYWHHTGVKVCSVFNLSRDMLLQYLQATKYTAVYSTTHTGSNSVVKWQTQGTFCTFYLQNVLKFSVQRLTNEVQQIMHASLALLYPLLCLASFRFCRRWGVQKRKKKKVKLIYKRITRAGFLTLT